MKHKLYKGDCLEIMKNIGDKSVDMILCDLPYGNKTGKTRAKWDNDINIDELCSEYCRVITDNGVIVLHGNEPFSSFLRFKMLDIYKYDLKWIKSKTTGFANANYRPMNKYEDILIFSKANASTGGRNNPMCYNPQGLVEVNKKKTNSEKRHGLIMNDTNNTGKNNALLQEGSKYIQKFTNYPCNVVYFENEKKYVHPTQKPIELLEYLIKTYSNIGSLILDNTCGSNSTGIACLNANRDYIGIEKDDKYFDICISRTNEYIEKNSIECEIEIYK